MKSLLGSLLTVSLLLMTAVYSTPVLPQSGDLCQHEAAKNVDVYGDCQEFSMDMERSGQRFKGHVAKVLRKAWRAGDVGLTKHDYLIRLPSGKVVNLGNFKPLTGYPFKRSQVAETYLYRSLEIDPGRAGGTCCISPSLFYEKALVTRNERYCVAYSMIHPLQGTYYDCDGVAEPSGSIGYIPGAVSWRTARQLACAEFGKITSQSCKGPYNRQLATRIRRTDDGKLFYMAAIVHAPKGVSGNTPSKQKKLIGQVYIYRIEAVNGDIRRVATNIERLRRNRWFK